MLLELWKYSDQLKVTIHSQQSFCMHVKKLYTHQFHLANNFNGSPQDFFFFVIRKNGIHFYLHSVLNDCIEEFLWNPQSSPYNPDIIYFYNAVGTRNHTSLPEDSISTSWNADRFAWWCWHHWEACQEPSKTYNLRTRRKTSERVTSSEICGMFSANSGMYFSKGDFTDNPCCEFLT